MPTPRENRAAARAALPAAERNLRHLRAEVADQPTTQATLAAARANVNRLKRATTR